MEEGAQEGDPAPRAKRGGHRIPPTLQDMCPFSKSEKPEVSSGWVREGGRRAR